MPTISRGGDRLACSGARCATRVARNSVRKIADSLAPGLRGTRRRLMPPVTRPAALALSLLLAACAAPGSGASSPYHTPNDVDIGGGGGGGGGM